MKTKDLLNRMNNDQLQQLVLDLSDENQTIKYSLDAALKNLESARENFRVSTEKETQLNKDYKRSQDRVAVLFDKLAQIGHYINFDGEEKTDGECIDWIMETLSEEFDIINGKLTHKRGPNKMNQL